ncbi:MULTISPECIES: hypothetical protein [Flammeovirga]|uniref:Uncharacterized protein n=1 Tax=Flammeovirga agarivorans TaxID=2726742 RepID=A0A7X8XUC3_9BACT|nr:MULTISPECIES: hypothetical protein [Flammeovirga]NLR90257.1 hypothetical protein [Flammeovirga agarivorans]
MYLEAWNKLRERFEIEEPDFKADSFGETADKLSEYFEHLLRTDSSRLMNGLYRIDVREDLVKEAFEQGSLTDIADALARLALRREWEKQKMRERWSNMDDI